jgi:sortase A
MQKGAVPKQKVLTLTTCHPKYSARQRLIVFAVLDTALPKSQGEPPSLTAGG